jgi:hypothetical protein
MPANTIHSSLTFLALPDTSAVESDVAEHLGPGERIRVELKGVKDSEAM